MLDILHSCSKSTQEHCHFASSPSSKRCDGWTEEGAKQPRIYSFPSSELQQQSINQSNESFQASFACPVSLVLQTGSLQEFKVPTGLSSAKIALVSPLYYAKHDLFRLSVVVIFIFLCCLVRRSLNEYYHHLLTPKQLFCTEIISRSPFERIMNASPDRVCESDLTQDFVRLQWFALHANY